MVSQCIPVCLLPWRYRSIRPGRQTGRAGKYVGYLSSHPGFETNGIARVNPSTERYLRYVEEAEEAPDEVWAGIREEVLGGEKHRTSNIEVRMGGRGSSGSRVRRGIRDEVSGLRGSTSVGSSSFLRRSILLRSGSFEGQVLERVSIFPSASFPLYAFAP